MKNLMLIIVGPSGAGKSSFVDRAVSELDFIHDVITCTTRSMRPGEKPGEPYHFMDENQFRELIDKNYFVEWAQVHDKLYGTPKNSIEEAWANNKVVIMDVDVQGAKTFMEKYPEEAYTIFIIPPSIDELRHRVEKRDGGTTKDLDLRMANAKKEIEQAGDFHAQLVNDDFAKAYDSFKKIIDEQLEKR